MTRSHKLALLVVAAVAPVLSCGSRSLVLIDVKGSVAFSDVRLALTANRDQKTSFAHVNLNPSTPYQIGIYLPSDMTGTVAFEGEVDDGTCIRGTGSTSVAGVQAGETSNVAQLMILPTSGCVPITDGGTGGRGGAGAAGGTSGGGGMTGAGGTTGNAGMTGAGGLTGGGGTIGAGGLTGGGGTIGAAGATGAGGRGGTTGAAGSSAGGVVGTAGSTGRGGTTGAAGTFGTAGTTGTGIGGRGGIGGGGATTGVAGSMGRGGSMGFAGSIGAAGSMGFAGSMGKGGTFGGGGSMGAAGSAGCACVQPFVCDVSGNCVCGDGATCQSAGLQCGQLTNACNQTVNCGPCPVGSSCVNGNCVPLCVTGAGGSISTAAPPICL